ncbi:MAG: hypothetical protein WCB68_17120 [Pyrinomonadaceae bacterium]
MKAIFLTLIILCAGSLSVRAQARAQKTQAAPLSDEQQQQIERAVAQAQMARTVLDLARAKAETAQAQDDAAQAQLVATIYRVMAELGLPPKHWRLQVGNNGKVEFVQAEESAPPEKPLNR